MGRSFKMKLTLALLLTIPSVLQAAQDVNAVSPGAGSILQQTRTGALVAPSATAIGLTIDREGVQTLLPGTSFEVTRILISGNTRFDTATLHAMVASAEGKATSLADFERIVARVTDYYRAHGFPLARAIIPAQEIKDGVVRIEVIEASYGNINLDNQSRVKDKLLQSTLSDLKGGDAIEQTGLDHALLLLSDIPGVIVAATLRPGQTVGTSDLNVNTRTGSTFSGNVASDSYGNEFTGRTRAGATLNFIDPFHHGDVLTLSVLSSGRGMNYGRVTYESLLTGHGTRAGVSYSALGYVLGEPIASLDAHGNATVESAWIKRPLVRKQNRNLYLQIQFDRMQLRDRIDVSSIRNDRSLRSWTATLAGDGRDETFSGAATAWNIGWTTGRLAFDDRVAEAADAATASTQDRFSKWNVNLARLQGLNAQNALYLAMSGQWAHNNLDPSQKLLAGGPYTVRGYDMGAILADSGYLISVELRHNLGSAGGHWQVVTFSDYAKVTINRDLWTQDTNSATLRGAGLGLNWSGRNDWSVRAFVARPIGTVPSLLPDRSSTRAGIEITKGV